MSIGLLGALMVAGLAGPLLNLPKRWNIPVAVGELLTGGVLGASGLNKIPYKDPTLVFLATIGFALLMFTAGSHIDFRSINLGSMKKSFWILSANFTLAIIVGLIVSSVSHFTNWKLLSVILFSSSAAFVLPIVANSLPSKSRNILVTQVILADAISFILLPFFTQQSGQFRAAIGALIVLIASLFIYFVLRFAKSKTWLDRTHEISKVSHLGIELRISLAFLLIVAALATHFHASVMIAGFSLGVVLATIGVPHRLARQLFAVSDGFFAPLFFVWLGSTIDIKSVFQSRDSLILAGLLCIGTFITHIPSKLFGEPNQSILLTSAQLGIPAAAVTLGSAGGIINSSQSGAIMLCAVVTLIVPSLTNSKTNRM